MSESAGDLSSRAAAQAVVDLASARDYVAILKPRVMSLVVFTGLAGLLLAPGGANPLIGAVAVLAIALGAGAAGAINMWYDRDIDAVMTRTCARPIPAGRMRPEEALSFGVALAAGSVLLMGLVVGLAAAALLALSIAFYVFVYTVWLKRRTPQNIVIGGAAGAFPPVIGWAAATGDVGIEALILFALIFFWTPPHFWSLALYRSADYARAGVPMLPVVAGERETRRQILLYSAVVAAISLAPLAVGLSGPVYGVSAVLLSATFLYRALAVFRDRGVASAKRMFGFSIVYLFLIFCALIADRAAALLGWA
ncbi:MAG: protoheme IX farnesyltransferase [Proteobacteria bacterium]|nr:protoheme IX farnesyltransferase [Pseudomonadota bacterium]